MRQAIPAADKRSLVAFAALLALCFLVAALASAVTLPKVDSWFANLAKPSFQPPNFLFGPVWAVLYTLMAVAAWRVWRTMGEPDLRRRALALFGAQLAFNGAWPFVFFGTENLALGLVVIVALEALILATIALFSRLDRPAALLLVPYAAWVAFAAALNFAVLRLN